MNKFQGWDSIRDFRAPTWQETKQASPRRRMLRKAVKEATGTGS